MYLNIQVYWTYNMYLNIQLYWTYNMYLNIEVYWTYNIYLNIQVYWTYNIYLNIEVYWTYKYSCLKFYNMFLCVFYITFRPSCLSSGCHLINRKVNINKRDTVILHFNQLKCFNRTFIINSSSVWIRKSTHTKEHVFKIYSDVFKIFSSFSSGRLRMTSKPWRHLH